jgi:hypothetical protein
MKDFEVDGFYINEYYIGPQLRVARSIFQGATRQLINRRMLHNHLNSPIYSNFKKGSIAGDSK